MSIDDLLLDNIVDRFQVIGSFDAYRDQHIYELVPATVEGYYLRRRKTDLLDQYSDDTEWYVNIIARGRSIDGWFSTTEDECVNQDTALFVDTEYPDFKGTVVIRKPEDWKQYVCKFTGDEEQHRLRLQKAKDDKKARETKKIMRFNFSDKTFKEVRG